MFHEGRGTDYRKQMIEMHISEIGFCSGHSASGVFVDENARTSVDGLYAAGDMANVPHNYMLGAFTNGCFAGNDAAKFARDLDFAKYDEEQVIREKERVLAPTKRADGIPPNQIEYKIRRLVNDYLQPPKVTRKMELGMTRLQEARDDMENSMMASNSHELMRALEVSSIIDCAEMAAVASLYRTESRWGLYHNRVEYAGKNNDDWFCHTLLSKSEKGDYSMRKKDIKPYIVDIEEDELGAYDNQRVASTVVEDAPEATAQTN